MAEERAFELLESVGEPVVYRSPNYLRLVQAYRSYVEEGGSAVECALRLREITRPGLQRFHLPASQALPEAGWDTALRINGSVTEMVRALYQGDRAALTQHFEEASDGFRELCQLAVTSG